MNRLRRNFLWCLAGMILLSACTEQGVPVAKEIENLGPVTLQASLQPEEATIGDVITYTLRVSRSSGVLVELPELTDRIEGLIFLDRGQTGPSPEGERIIESLWMTFRAEKVGASMFPAVKATYTAQEQKGTVEAPAMTLDVKSVLPPEMKDIKDIKPLEKPGPDKRLLFFVTALLLLLVLLILAFWLKTRKKKSGLEFVPAPLPPHEEAEQALAKLEGMKLIEQGEIKRYYYILSEIFRRYLERRFQISAVERTTEEILGDLPALNVDQEIKKHVRHFLVNTDLPKFAGVIPETGEIIKETQGVRDFLRKTSLEQPREEPEASHVEV